MKIFGQGRLSSAGAIVALLVAAGPLTAQEETPPPAPAEEPTTTTGTVAVTPALVDVLVGALELATSTTTTTDQSTAQLISVLLSDPLVAAVLQDAGAVDVATPAGDSPWQVSPARMQELMSEGAPDWFAQAIQVSVDQGLSIVTPLNVLLVLVDSGDPAVTAFLREQELEAEPLRRAIEGTLAELARRIG